MAAQAFGEPPRQVRVPADDGGEPPRGASSPVRGSYRSPPGAGARTGSVRAVRSVAATASVRFSDSTRAARLAEGREKEYAMAISWKCRRG